MAPGGVRVGELLPQLPTLGEVALSVGVGGEVGAVDGDVLPELRQLVVQRRQNGCDAGVKQWAEPAQLDGEAVAGVRRGSTTDGVLKGGMLSDESHCAGPRRKDVERLHQRHADHGTDGVAGAARPAGCFQPSNESAYFGRCEQGCDLPCVAVRRYAGLAIGVLAPWSGPPEVAASGGHLFLMGQDPF